MVSTADVASPPAFDARGALSRADVLCRARGVRLTELRRRVLEILWRSPTPLGAYTILEVLRDEGRPGAPPTVYRTLEFLLEQGLIHRLPSLNGFVGCRQPDQRHGGQFLICQECGRVDELNSPAIERLLRAEAAACGFTVVTQAVEASGQCSACRRKGVEHDG